jgi:aminopeptidase N
MAVSCFVKRGEERQSIIVGHYFPDTMNNKYRVMKVVNRCLLLGAGGVAMSMAGACAASSGSEDELGEEVAALVQAPTPGSAGIGDALFPTLGNGGYDVIHYDLELRYETSAPSQSVDGNATILARATQSLSRFDLDFAGDSVGAVSVNGSHAGAVRDGEELVITPSRPIRNGEFFIVRVEHFAASPKVPDPRVLLGTPFVQGVDGSAWLAQPNGAHSIFPSNDHPSDKASYSFRINVPEGTTAAASGISLGHCTINGRTTWAFLQIEPMASELAQVSVGAQTLIDRGLHNGVAFRDAVPTRLAAELEPKLAIELAHLDWLEARLGAYPFKSYGSLLVDSPIGVALESQTLSLYSTSLFSRPETSYAPIMVHELAHQWFGDSVAPAKWADVWLNEGHATWYEYQFRTAADPARFETFLRTIYRFGDLFRAAFGPVASPLSGDPNALFSNNAYFGGMLVLYALRQQVGDALFQDIERAWVTTYRGRSASTADFIALASQVSGQDLTAYLNDWLYGTKTPAMPGHPDWVVLPAPTAAALTAELPALPAELVDGSEWQWKWQ